MNKQINSPYLYTMPLFINIISLMWPASVFKVSLNFQICTFFFTYASTKKAYASFNKSDLGRGMLWKLFQRLIWKRVNKEKREI